MSMMYSAADFNVAAPSSDLARQIAARVEGRSGSLKVIADERTDGFRLNPYLIKVKPDLNSRNFESEDTLAHVKWLAESIAEHGVKNPLTVYQEGDAYYLSDGECRLRAVHYAINKLEAEIVSVPVIMETRGDGEADRILAQIVKNSGKPFTVMETAVVVKKLHALGLSIDEIGRKIGRVKEYVAGLLDLNSVPEAAKAMVNSGKIKPTLLNQLRRQHGSGAALLDALRAAGRAAEAAGKSRITARYAPSRKAPLKSEVKTILQRSFDNEEFSDGESEVVFFTVTIEDYRRLKALGVA